MKVKRFLYKLFGKCTHDELTPFKIEVNGQWCLKCGKRNPIQIK